MDAMRISCISRGSCSLVYVYVYFNLNNSAPAIRWHEKPVPRARAREPEGAHFPKKPIQDEVHRRCGLRHRSRRHQQRQRRNTAA